MSYTDKSDMDTEFHWDSFKPKVKPGISKARIVEWFEEAEAKLADRVGSLRQATSSVLRRKAG